MVPFAWSCVALALTVRVGLIEWNAQEWLGSRIEVSSPLTSWNRSRRGHSLFQSSFSDVV
jgi:hypothetical protein